MFLDNSIELPLEELLPLEKALSRALETGDEKELEILGYGEISCVLAHAHGGRRYACKRLPPFAEADHFDRYLSTFEQYVARLRSAGVRVVGSKLYSLPGERGISAWCVQPRLSKEALLPVRMQGIPEDLAVQLFERLLELICGCVGPALGLDGQLSNWVWVEGEPGYLDVTTPMMRDAQGKELLNMELFLASLPWGLRPLVRRFLLKSILDKYYEPRGVVLDLLGNLYKEKLNQLIEPFLQAANRRFHSAPITLDEIRRYYEDDARTWALLQRLRRADRMWQRSVRRRVYPFLLPGRIER